MEPPSQKQSRTPSAALSDDPLSRLPKRQLTTPDIKAAGRGRVYSPCVVIVRGADSAKARRQDVAKVRVSGEAHIQYIN